MTIDEDDVNNYTRLHRASLFALISFYIFESFYFPSSQDFVLVEKEIFERVLLINELSDGVMISFSEFGVHSILFAGKKATQKGNELNL
ncbi:hypothetical protein DLM75_22885 [Leptospira stimsonii]|uniref:Uncharacterized protein n=1 Tax=Leptospira stimsonii TaxID=2202203 RepID=A0A396YSJ5_9LEPT|nr:hypothetical protein DLM75_22885 [Leptospira stimsonii]